MELKVKKKEGPVFAADLQQLVRATEQPPRERLVLGGQLFMCSLEALRSLEGFVEQPARSTVRSLPFSRNKKPRKLYLALEREALATVVRARIRPVFAIDALLRYGQRLKEDDSVVLCAMQGTQASMVTSLHFRRGELVSLDEFVLAAPSSHTFEADLHVLLERLRMQHMGAVFHWCGPLSMPRSQTFVQAPASMWAAATPQALTMSGRSSVLRRHGIALAVASLSVAGYGAALWYPYSQYLHAASTLAADNARLQSEYRFATERLAMLQALQGFARVSETNTAPLGQFAAVMQALGTQDGLRIREARLNWARARIVEPGRPALKDAYDFEVLLEVPRTEGVTALEQSVPLMRGLSDQLGMNLRLATTEGMREVPPAEGKKPARQYRVQGDFRHAP